MRASTFASAQRAWRDLQAARRAYDELTRDAAAAQAALDELRALAEDTQGLEAGQEDELRADRERLRHLGELAEAAATAAAALAPDDGDGATDLVAAAERAVAPLERLAPELAAAGDALRQPSCSCARRPRTCVGSSPRWRPSPAGSSSSSPSSTASPT